MNYGSHPRFPFGDAYFQMLFQPPLDLPLHLPSPRLLPLLLCPVTSCPRCEDDRVISVMSSRGKWEAPSGGLEGGRAALPAILASAMTCCDTRERSARHTRFISFYSGLSVTSQPAGPHHHHPHPHTHTPTPERMR